MKRKSKKEVYSEDEGSSEEDYRIRPTRTCKKVALDSIHRAFEGVRYKEPTIKSIDKPLLSLDSENSVKSTNDSERKGSTFVKALKEYDEDSQFEIMEDEEYISKEEENVELLLTEEQLLKEENKLAKQCSEYFSKGKEWLQTMNSNFLRIDGTVRASLLRQIGNFNKELHDSLELYQIAQVLLAPNFDTQGVGQFSKIKHAEIWAVVFSFLSFEDFIKISRVCKLWNSACTEFSYSLTSFDFTNKMNFEMSLTPVEIYQKHIAHRKDYITSISNIPSSLLRYFERHDIKFLNANSVKYFTILHLHENTDTLDFSKIDTNNINKLILGKWTNNIEPLNLNNLEEIVFTGSDSFDKNFNFIQFGSKCKKLTFETRSPNRIIECLHNSAINDLFEQITDLEVEALYPTFSVFPNITHLVCGITQVNTLKAIAPKLKSLTIFRLNGDKANIANELINLEKLIVRHKVISKLDISSLFKNLTYLSISTVDEHKSYKESFSLQLSKLKDLFLYTYNQITVDCPNLERFYLGEAINDSDFVKIYSNKLQHFTSKRKIKILSIKGPCLLQNCDFLSLVDVLYDFECPLLSKLYINNCLLELLRSSSFQTVFTKHLRKLVLKDQTDLSFFSYPMTLESLELMNCIGCINLEILKSYSKNVTSIKSLTVINCSSSASIINSLFCNSTELIELKIKQTTIYESFIKSLGKDGYPNIKVLHLDEIDELRVQKVEYLFEKLSKRKKLENFSFLIKTGRQKKLSVLKNVSSFRTTFMELDHKSGSQNLKRLVLESEPFTFKPLTKKEKTRVVNQLRKLGKTCKHLEYLSVKETISVEEIVKILEAFKNIKVFECCKLTANETKKLEKIFPKITVIS
ncbi:hypothetical protein ABK040_006274 [Willaertia magna]